MSSDVGNDRFVVEKVQGSEVSSEMAIVLSNLGNSTTAPGDKAPP